MIRPALTPNGAAFVLAVVAGLASGCARGHDTPEQAVADACSTLGPLAATGRVKHGRVAEAAVGSAVAAGAGGLAVGGMFAMAVGASLRQLDPVDCAYAHAAAQTALADEAGAPVAWNAPTGSRGTFARTGAVFEHQGWRCQKLAATMDLHDREPIRDDVGTFCRVADGRWGRIAAPTVYRSAGS